MGNGATKDGKVDQAGANAAIEHALQKAAGELRKTVKLLLLGAGESGKSTVLKQMRILHTSGFQQEEYLLQQFIIYVNILQSAIALIKAMNTFSLQFESSKRMADSTTILSTEKNLDDSSSGNKLMTTEISSALKRLWDDRGIQAAFEHRSEINLHDSTKYFFDELSRISAPDYRPSQQDMLRASVRTTGIVEVGFEAKNLHFRVFDVGGQRSERKKWIHCFDDVNAIIFVSSLSEFDQRLYEDHEMNRMHESLVLFESVINSQWFTKTSMILFLNKVDLFEDKLKHKSITIAFPEYTGTQDFEESVKYIQGRYLSENHHHDRRIFTHRTCATDTKQIEFVLKSTIEMLVEKNLSHAGLQ